MIKQEQKGNKMKKMVAMQQQRKASLRSWTFLHWAVFSEFSPESSSLMIALSGSCFCLAFTDQPRISFGRVRHLFQPTNQMHETLPPKSRALGLRKWKKIQTMHYHRMWTCSHQPFEISIGIASFSWGSSGGQVEPMTSFLNFWLPFIGFGQEEIKEVSMICNYFFFELTTSPTFLILRMMSRAMTESFVV